MAESQSRYGIMETLNTKKTEAQKKKNQLEREMELQKMKFEEDQATFDSNIANNTATYKQVHSRWKNSQEFEIKNKEMEYIAAKEEMERKHKESIQAIKNQIEEKDSTVEDRHKEYIKSQEEQKKNQEKQFEQWTKVKKMELQSLDNEIKGIESTLHDLKEVSKESTKKE